MPLRFLKGHLKNGIEKFGWTVGRYSYGNPTVVNFANSGKLEIGKYCSIASGVTIFLGGEHRTDWVTTYPFSVFPKKWPTGAQVPGHPASKGDVVIGHDVWIGHSATIMSGVTIGHGAVVANHAVVMADVPDYGIAIGNPARTFKKRFSDEAISKLLDLKWWDWTDAQIAEALPLMLSTNIEHFLETYKS
jgi:chloramphenicol O-acetyltransferase type B